MNSIVVVLLSLALVSFVSSVDVTLGGSIVADDSQATFNNVGITAGAALSSVSFTATPSDPSITIYYPGSGTKTTIGNIANGATGFGGFQVLGSAGYYTIQFNVSYKKANVPYNYTGSLGLVIQSSGGGGTEGKRIEEFQVQLANEIQSVEARNGNADFSVDPYIGFVADDATPVWQSISVVSKGSALTSVTFTVTPNDPSISIYYGPNGNTIPNVAANGRGGSSFQMSGNVGRYVFAVKVNYRKAGIAYTYTENLDCIINAYDTSGGSSEGKRLVVGGAFLPSISQNMNYATVAGLAIGGVALIAIVAVVVVVAVVRRQRTTIVA